jgi:multidrug efflux pump subunit AcrB
MTARCCTAIGTAAVAGQSRSDRQRLRQWSLAITISSERSMFTPMFRIAISRSRTEDRRSSKESDFPKATSIIIRGQARKLNQRFTTLGMNRFAALLVYFLWRSLQSWIDPLIIISALPGAFAGILWMLFATHTTFNVPSLMGAIMCIGVATSNSILLITFANDQRLKEGKDATEAALAAGATRMRPILMTALAMVLGMIPMSLALGEGSEQNAPLARAVIGGLLVATVTTLFFVPVVYSMLRRKRLTVAEDASFFDQDEPERITSESAKANSHE